MCMWSRGTTYRVSLLFSSLDVDVDVDRIYRCQPVLTAALTRLKALFASLGL